MRTEWVVKDLQEAPIGKSFGWFNRWAEQQVYDPRDVYIVRYIAKWLLVIPPLATLLFVKFHWAVAAVYLAALFLVFVHTYTLGLHHTAHRTLFKKHRWMNQLIPGFMGPFMGQPPNGYYGHHIGMHHPENNLPPDLSSTMKYERDNLFHWLRYFFRFFFGILFELTHYLWKHNRKRLAVNAVLGEYGIFLGLVMASMYVEWRAGLVVFVVPYLIVRTAMMMGNWGQHAFVDAKHPENPHLNSITCINTEYNRTGFNDGYHIGHHVKANRHWVEMPADFLANLEAYHRDGAIVFEGIDFFGVWANLMLHRYKKLASHYVCLDRKPKTEEEVIALLKLRTRPIRGWEPAAEAPPQTEPQTA
jgi:Fatty acid desaturase